MLFKILKGASSRISTAATPFNEGYAYFTPDDAGFYIDATVDSTQKRVRVNQPSTSVTATLKAADWSSGKQTVSITGLGANQNGSVGLVTGATDAQITAARAAGLFVSAQTEGSLTVQARDATPSVDIPIVVTMLY